MPLAAQRTWLPNNGIGISRCGLGFLRFGGLFRGRFLRFFFHDGRRHVAVTIIHHHRGDDFRHHLFQFVKELSGFVFMLLDFTEFFLPDACQFSTFQQVFMDEADEFDARGRGFETFANLFNIVAL